MTTQQWKTLKVGGQGQTVSDSATLRSQGIYTDESGQWPELIAQYDGDWRAGTSSAAHDLWNPVDLSAVTIDLTNDRIPYAAHGFMLGEAVYFTGDAAHVPQVGGADVSLTVLFYVKPYDANTIELYTTRSLGSKLNFSGQAPAAAAWQLNRMNYCYTDGVASAGALPTTVGALMNTIGAPAAATTKRYPTFDKFWDFGCDVPANALIAGGSLMGQVSGLALNYTGSARTIYLVVDMNSDVKAQGVSNPGIAVTATDANDLWTCTNHGLLSKEVVQIGFDGASALPGGVSAYTNYYVSRQSSSTFKLYTDVALTSLLALSADGAGVCMRAPVGSANRIRFAASLPDDIGVERTISVTGAEWTDATKRLTKAGAFTTYIFRSTDQIYISGGTGATVGWYTPASVDPSGNYITLTASIGAGANGQTDIAGQLHVLARTPFMWRWWCVPDAGVQGTTSGTTVTSLTENALWYGELLVATDGYAIDPATAGGTRITQTFTKTRPQANNTAQTQRHEWGPTSIVRYYPAVQADWPLFRFTAGQIVVSGTSSSGALVGGTSGAKGVVIFHDLDAQTLTYRPDDQENDFIPGETLSGPATLVSDGSATTGSLVTNSIFRGPLPTRVSVRFGVAGVQDGTVEMAVHHMQVTLNRQRLS